MTQKTENTEKHQGNNNDNKPVATGRINLGVLGEYHLAMWKQTSKKGTTYYSLSASAQNQNGEYREVATGALFPEKNKE